VYRLGARLGAKQIVSASSAAIYGDCGMKAIAEDFPYNGISPYADTKYRIE
jgi:UDP-glucose 4-epimerase